MDELRDKLLPVFLRDAEGHLADLRGFFAGEPQDSTNRKQLDAAYRAAHALKCSADLVKAESIGRIAERIEKLLGRHFAAQSLPTAVEYEALRLAVDWLAPLVSALQGDLAEPKIFVDEALQALDLAEAFPGSTPLAQLLDGPQAGGQPVDPFASDPDLPDEVGWLTAQEDPFAEDPVFGLQVGLVAQDPADAALPDPFAEDEQYLSEGLQVPVLDPQLDTGRPPEPLPFDPFAEDELELELDPSGPLQTGSFAEEAADPSSQSELLNDPFAEDAAFLPELETLELDNDGE